MLEPLRNRLAEECLYTSEKLVELILAADRQMYALLSEFGADIPIHRARCAMCPERNVLQNCPGASSQQHVAGKRQRVALICLLTTGRPSCATDLYTVEHGNLVTVCIS